MKKIYITLIVLLPAIAFGQAITIGQSDLPAAGWGYVNAIDSAYTDPIPPGGNQTWNYTGLQNLYQDSLLFIPSAGTPYASYYPNSNIAAFNPNDGTYTYFITNSTGFYLNGTILPQFSNLVAVFNPPQMYIPVPFTYNDTYSGFSRVVIDTMLAGDSTRIIIHTDINLIADGYGTLNLPGASIPNTLRIKQTKLETDSILQKLPVLGWILIAAPANQTTEFVWVRHGSGTLVLDINADSLGVTANRSSYQVFFAALGVNEITNPVATNTFPNPASDKVTFAFESSLSESSELTVTNLAGQEVESFNVTRLNSFTMSTARLSNGMYSYIIRNEKGIHAKGKFTVMH
ncbi:MAG: T9SS type A sorting domain-containing protein [Bacteroidia bacterium]